VFASCGSGDGCERETDFAVLLNGVRTLLSAVEKRSRPALRAENISRSRRSACEREADFAALLNGVRTLLSAVEKRSRPALRAENISRSRRSAFEKRSGPGLII
jgi:hypothetical protein